MRLRVAICLFWSLMPCRAEITLDGSLGSEGALMPDPGNEINIEAGMGRQAGSNLFHSFGVFNVKANETAIFNDTGATALVENILSRVTGGSSRIDGTITTSFQSSDPNLFLLNPAGMVFGPNAELNVEGSFHASTGGFIELAD
ncbi:MAG: filamentous hemagglutinin N-terminal domain-containing protein, partial [Gammaproteobacteria bacterium]